MNPFRRKLILGLLILALLSPLGLILPSMFKSGEPFGESSGTQVKNELGYTPGGMKKDEKLWKSPVKNYSIGEKERPLWEKSLFYVGSGLLGVVIIGLGTVWLNKFYKNND